MDDIDRAQSREAEFLNDALAEHKRHRAPSLIPCGACHWCGEGIQPGHLWCDNDCEVDYEADQAHKRREGK